MNFQFEKWFLCVSVLFGLHFLSHKCLYVDAVSQQVLFKTLHDDLMTDYDSSLIPICSTGANVTLSMDIALRQILDMNEREQILSTNIWMRLTWNDCRLTWAPSSYGNLTYMMLPYSDVWVPDITLYDSAAEEVMFPGFENFRASVYSGGSVTYNFPTVTKSICRVNVYYFPFDTQKCSLQFGSWSHHGLELDIINKNPSGDVDAYIENSEWILKEIPVTRHVAHYNCCPEPYPDVTYYIIMKRRPSFYLLTMIFPCIIVTFVATLAFLLPVESGEKVSLEITVLLSLAVFLLLVSEELPPSSDNFPLIGSYFASSMALVSLSLVQSVFVLNVFYRGTNGRKLPRWARKVFFQYVARFLCLKWHNVDSVEPTDQEARRLSVGLDPTFDSFCASEGIVHENFGHEANIKNNHIKQRVTQQNGLMTSFVNYRDPVADIVQHQTKHIQYIAENFTAQKAEDMINYEWRDLSNILDRSFLIIYVLTTLITTLALLLQCVVNS